VVLKTALFFLIQQPGGDSMIIKKNILHYYVDLLRLRDSEHRSRNQTDSCVNALHNIIRTMMNARHNIICAEDFTALDWGTISFNNIDFSNNGEMPCDFSHSFINRWNFIFGHQGRIKNFFYIPTIDKLLTYSNKEIIFWNLATNLPCSIIYATEFNEECDISFVEVLPDEKVFIVGTDLGDLYVRSFIEPNRNLFVQSTDEEIADIHYFSEIDKLVTVNLKYYNENGKIKEKKTIKCWSVNKFRSSKLIWNKIIFDGYGQCDVAFTSEFMVVSHYYFDNRTTITEAIAVHNGAVIDTFHDDDSFSQLFISLDEQIIVLELDGTNAVSVHYPNSEKPSFLIQDAALIYTDSTPFSNDSTRFLITREDQVLWFNLSNHSESLLISLPSGNDMQFEMTTANDYGLIYDFRESDYYLINIKSGTISKANLPLPQLDIIEYMKYSSHLNQFLIADNYVFTTFNLNEMSYRALEISNSDSTYRLITTENSCIFMLLNHESIEVDLQTGKVIHEYLNYDDNLIALSQDGNELRASYYHDYSLEDWVVHTTTLINGTNEIPLYYHKDECTAGCFSRDSRYGISGSSNTIAIWDSQNGGIVEWYLADLESKRSVQSLAISYNKKYIGFISTSDKYNDYHPSQTVVTVFDRSHHTNPKELHLKNLDGTSNPVARLAFLEKSNNCIIACDDGRIIIWDYDNNNILFDKNISFPKEYQYCMDIAISMNGKRIVYDMDNRTAFAVDVSTIISESSYKYKTIHYLPKLHLSKCNFKGCILDNTTRKILCQYGADI